MKMALSRTHPKAVNDWAIQNGIIKDTKESMAPIFVKA
jgi:hypothetical protein